MIARAVVGICGIGGIVLAVFLGTQNTIGMEAGNMGQILLIVLCVLLIVIAILGDRLPAKRLVSGYQQVAVILLNTLLFFVVVELLVILSFNAQFATQQQKLVVADQTLPVLQDADWLKDYEAEETEFWRPRYSPFDLWTLYPFEGEVVSIQADGARGTARADCTPESYRIFMYGGSTMWGVTVPDDGTIPAYVQTALANVSDKPVCVVNYGEVSFVSSQAMIRLIKQLQVGNIPDMAIFYDGVNDVVAAYNNNDARKHRSLSNFVKAIETPAASSYPVQWLMNSYTVKFLQSRFFPEDQTTLDAQREGLAPEIIANYEATLRIISLLASEYAFEPVFLWQPVMVVGEKPLTQEEVAMSLASPPALTKLYRDTWALASGIDHPNFYDLADVMDGIEAPLYVDHHHLAIQGNEVVAKRIVEIILPKLLISGQ